MSLQAHSSPLAGAASAALRRGEGWLRRDSAALLIFLAAALLCMAPALAGPRDRVLGAPGDNIQYAYMAGWMAQAPLLGQSPFRDPRGNYPDGLSLTDTDAPYLHMLAVAPATLALGPVFGYNLIIFFSHLLTGYTAYLWVLRLSGSRAGGVVAGLAFLLTPNRILHSYGNLPTILTQSLVLFFWALDAALAARRPGWRELLALALASLLLGGSSQYMLISGLVCGAAYALFSLALSPAGLLRRAAVAAGATVIGAALSALPYLLGAYNRSYRPYSFADSRTWSTDPLNFLRPGLLHPLWGEWFQTIYPEHLFGEKTLYIGALAGALALAALLWRRHPQRRRMIVWAGTALVGALFALGTDLNIGGRPLSQERPFLLPAYYLSQLPFLSAMRVWPRFGIVTLLFVALLAGLGAARLLASLPRGRHLATLALLGLLLLDQLPGARHGSQVEPRPVDRWLAAQPGDFAVGFMPPVITGNDAANYRALYGTLFHGKQVASFFHPYHRTPAYEEYVARAAGFPAPESVARLRALGLRYLVLLHADYNGAAAPAWPELAAQLRAAPGLAVVAELDGATVVGFR